MKQLKALKSNVNSLLLFSVFSLTLLYGSVVETVFNAGIGPVLFMSMLILVFFNLKFQKNLVYFLFFVILSISISIFYNSSNLASGGFRSGLFTGLIFILFAIKIKPINDELFSKLLCFLLIITALVTIFIYLNGIYFSDYFITRKGNVLGGIVMASFFENPNAAGRFFVTAAIFSLFFVKTKALKLSLCVIYSIFTLLSFSRSATLGLFLFYIINLGFYFRSAKRLFVRAKYYLIAGLTSILLLGVSQLQAILNKFTKKDLLSGREYLWKNAWEQSTSNLDTLIFGSGPSSFTADYTGMSAHNSYLNELANLGLIYIIAVAIFVLIIYLDSLQRKKYAFVALLVSGLAYGLVETAIFGGPNVLWVGIPLFLQLSTTKKQQLCEVQRR